MHEALEYIQESLQNMIDPPLHREALMRVDDVLFEMALLEEISMTKRDELKSPQKD